LIYAGKKKSNAIQDCFHADLFIFYVGAKD